MPLKFLPKFWNIPYTIYLYYSSVNMLNVLKTTNAVSVHSQTCDGEIIKRSLRINVFTY